MDIITLRYKRETGLTAYKFNFFGKRIGYTTDYTKWLEKQCTMRIVSQRSELLPEFLMEDLDGKIITSVIGSSDVTKEWNEYLGNCG